MTKIMYSFILVLLLSNSCSKNDEYFILLCQSSRSDMQYVYIDAENVTSDNDLDLNNDGIFDISMFSWSDSYPGGYNYGACIDVTNCDFSYALHNSDSERFVCGDGLGEDAEWCSGRTILFKEYEYISGESGSTYNWGLSDGVGYIAIRFNDFGKIKYGWIKVIDNVTRVSEYALMK